MKASFIAVFSAIASSTAPMLAAPLPAPIPGIIHGENAPPKHVRKHMKESQALMHQFGEHRDNQVSAALDALKFDQAPRVEWTKTDSVNSGPYASATRQLQDDRNIKKLDHHLTVAEQHVQELKAQNHKGLPEAVKFHEDLKEVKKWTMEENHPHKTVALPLIDAKKKEQNQDAHEVMQKSPYPDHPTVPTKKEMKEMDRIRGYQKYRSNKKLGEDRPVHDPVAREGAISRLEKERQNVAALLERNKPKDLKKQIQMSKDYVKAKVNKNKTSNGVNMSKSAAHNDDHGVV